MPAYHFIFHAYGSWLPDNPDGYHDRKVPGRQACNPNLARAYRGAQVNPELPFSQQEQQLLVATSKEIAASHDWGLHGIAAVHNHVHLIMSWPGEETASHIKQILKIQLTRSLNLHRRLNNGKRFSRGSGDRKIRDLDHLIELMRHYLPDHGENVWIEERIRLRL